MCAAWTSALLLAIVKEAVKMVGSSAQQSSLVRKAPLNWSSRTALQERGRNTERYSSSHLPGTAIIVTGAPRLFPPVINPSFRNDRAAALVLR